MYIRPPKNDWRDRLRSLDHVPGEEMPDKKLLWERLEKRLMQPVKPKPYITWIVVGLLILFLLLFVITC